MQKFIRHFKTVGLSEYETRTYITLLEHKISTAPQIASLAGIPTSKIYEVLASLHRKGFVVMEPGRPRRFDMVDPKIALRSFIDGKIKKLQKSRSRILARISRIEPKGNGSGIWIISGRETVESVLNERLSKAEKSIMLAFSQKVFRLNGLMDKLKNKGVKIDEKSSALRTNIINIDGKEMFLFAKSREALWIRDPTYSKLIDDSSLPLVVNNSEKG